MKLTDQIEINGLKKISEKVMKGIEKHKWIDYIMAPLSVGIILLTVYFIKDVYPFGPNTIAYYDMPSQYIPFYSGAWDFLHGSGSAYLDWFSGLGNSTVGGAGTYIFFPLNLFFLFVSRDNLLHTVSIFLLIKMCLAAFSMSYYIKKKYDIRFFVIVSGIMYACSGYVLQYYTNLFFLDFVILFPLIVWSVERLFNEGRPLEFVILFFLLVVSSYRMALMIVMYLIIKGHYELKYIPKEKKGRAVILFIVSGFVSAMLSAVILIPALYAIVGTSRVEGSSRVDYILLLKTVNGQFRSEKNFMMYGSEIAVGLFILTLLRGKECIKKYCDNIIMIIILGLPILHEGINLLWHAGTYKHFPMRFGYMLTFECLIFVGKYIKEEHFNEVKFASRIAKLMSFASFPFLTYVLFVFFEQFLKNGITDDSSLLSYNLYFLTLALVYFVIFIIDSKKARQTAILLLTLIQASIGMYGMIAPEIAKIDGVRVKYLLKALESENYFETKRNLNERVKANTEEYDPNYALIVQQPSIATWRYSMKSETERELLHNMGYDGFASSVFDSGGTVFTDALLGVKNIISSYNLNEGLYIDNPNVEGIYECRYSMPFGCVIDLDYDMPADLKNSFEYQNSLFYHMSGVNDLIEISTAQSNINNRDKLIGREYDELIDSFDEYAKTINSSERKDSVSNTIVNSNSNELEQQEGESEINAYTLKIYIEGKRVLYIDVKDKYEGDSLLISVNGQKKAFPSYLNEGEFIYPNTVRSGIADMGTYENEEIEMKIYTFDEDLNDVLIGTLDLDKLTSGLEIMKKRGTVNASFSNNGMSIICDTNRSGMLFLPVAYSDNWHAKVNGQSIKPTPCINDAFVSVEIPDGTSTIAFNYVPRGLIIGLIITAFAIIIILVYCFMRKYHKKEAKVYRYQNVIEKVFVYGYEIAFGILITIMYIVPVYVKLSI